jgi:hypothetical protein
MDDQNNISFYVFYYRISALLKKQLIENNISLLHFILDFNDKI